MSEVIVFPAPENLAFIRVVTPKMGECIFQIDPEDAERCKPHTWSIKQSKPGHSIYAKSKAGSLAAFLIQPPPGFLVDHINGNTFDNRKANLRICNRQQNAMNRSVQRNKRVRYKGVYPVYQKFQVQIGIGGGRNKYIGTFDTAVEAALAYNKAALELHGEFARLNPVTP